MPFLSQRSMRHISFAILVVSAIFTFIATAANYWTSLIIDDNFHQGLWKRCNGKTCFDFDADGSSQATRILMVLSSLCYCFAFSYCLLMHLVKNLSVKFLAAILFVTCILEVSALSIYTNNIGSNAAYQYRWCYRFGWTGAVLTFIVACLCFVENEYTNL